MQTFVRGHLVYDRGSIVAKPGHGRHVSGEPEGVSTEPARAGRGRRTVHGLALSLAAIAAASLVAVALSAAAPLIQQTFALSEVGVGAIASGIYAGLGRQRGRRRPAHRPAAARRRCSVGCLLLLAAGDAVAALAPAGLVFAAGVAVAGLGYGAVNPPTNVLADRAPAAGGRWRSASSRPACRSAACWPARSRAAGAGAVGWRWATAVPIAGCVAVAAVAALGPRDPHRHGRRRTPSLGPGRFPPPGPSL